MGRTEPKQRRSNSIIQEGLSQNTEGPTQKIARRTGSKYRLKKKNKKKREGLSQNTEGPIQKRGRYEVDLSVFPKVYSLLLENNALTYCTELYFSEPALLKIAVSFRSFVITQIRYVTVNHQEV